MILQLLHDRVETVDSGREAIEELKFHPVGLVILDMIMEPGLNGRERYTEILAQPLGQKAIIASCFAETEEIVQLPVTRAGATGTFR